VRDRMRAELLIDQFVAPFAKKVEIEIAEYPRE